LTGTVSVAQFGLGIQAWWGLAPFDAQRVERVAWPTQPIEKPQHGFFTSTWDGHTSAWIEYQAKTTRAAEARNTYLLCPHPGAVLYVIDSPQDYTALAEAYPQRYENPHHPPCPHWRHLAEEEQFDAVHMTAAAVADQNLWYAHRWAVESTLWFHPTLTVVDPS
jgi:hypothetical protein